MEDAMKEWNKVGKDKEAVINWYRKWYGNYFTKGVIDEIIDEFFKRWDLIEQVQKKIQEKKIKDEKKIRRLYEKHCPFVNLDAFSNPHDLTKIILSEI